MKAKFYSCDVCGNIISMVQDKGGQLVCCGKKMDVMVANSTDANEKTHKPVARNVAGELTIVVGEDAHPMIAEHHIEWVAVATTDSFEIYYLKAGDKPEKVIPPHIEGLLFAYCNLHGLWSQTI